MPAPRVSVICIYYNAERFIAEAIESVLAQNFRDFEIVLVNDGSRDSSRKSLAISSAAFRPSSAASNTKAALIAA